MSMVTGREPVKGFLARIRDGEMESVMDFQFNPTETTRGRTAEYNFTSGPGSPIPTASFKAIQGDTFSITLLFDAVETYEEAKLGTTAQKAFIESFTSPDFDDFSDDLGQFTPPPQARYGMGEESWDVLILSHNFRDVRWNLSGHPTRTWCELQMRTMFVDVASLRARFDFLASLRDLAAVQ